MGCIRDISRNNALKTKHGFIYIQADISPNLLKNNDDWLPHDRPKAFSSVEAENNKQGQMYIQKPNVK
jgi:hypothetical protein